MSAWKCFVMLCILFLSGCTSIQQLQDLEISLTKIEPVQPVGLSPRFNVHLLVANPNAQDLNIDGVSLQLNIADQKVLSGVSNQIPALKAYGETAVEIQTSISVFHILKILSVLNQQADGDIKYQLKTTIDPDGFIPFNISKDGLLNEDLLQGLNSISK